jgi:PAS domain S-box-containing protein
MTGATNFKPTTSTGKNMISDPIKIIYIDDSPFDRELVRDALEREQRGFQLTLATTQYEFEDYLKNNEFDLVLSDFNIAGFEGLEVIELVNEYKPNLPVVIVTGTGSEEVAVEALKMGAADYVIKTPEHIRRLHHTILQVMENQNLQKEKQKAQVLIQESEEHYRALFNSARDGIALLGIDTHKIEDCNPQFETLSGISKDELISQNIWGLCPAVNKNEIQNIFLDLHESGFVGSGEFELLQPGGKVIPIEFVVTEVDIHDRKFLQLMARDITERKKAEIELKAYSERLEEMVEDRTKELKEAQEQLVHQERMATLGQLSRGIAHELRTPLGAINNAAYFLNMVLEESDEDVKEALKILSKEVATSERIIKSLLDFARPRAAVQRRVEIQDLIDSVLLQVKLPEEISIIKEYDEDLPLVWVDPEQLQQAIKNLLKNAIQAMPEGGRLVLNAEPAGDDHVDISINDTGIGIDEGNLERIFEPLYTTRAKGIGLGLALAKLNLESNGGSISVESKLGSGSKFTLTLPVVKQ